MHQTYLSRSVLASFDGDQPQSQPPAIPPAGKAAEPLLTQSEVNRILAEERRKHQAKTDNVQRALEETLASKNLTVQERERLAAELENLQAQSRTAAEQAAHEKKQLEDKLTKEVNAGKKELEAWKHRYCEETTARALTDAAAGNDAFRPEQIVTVLKPYSRLTEIADERGKGTGKFKVLVDFPDQDENGQPTTVTHTPESAVRRMKDLPQIFGNLFRSGVVSGIGSGSGPGTPAGGKIDPRKLTQEQYMELRAKNPAALGLRPNKKGRA